MNHITMIISLAFSLIFYGSIINIYLFYGTMFCEKKVHSVWRRHNAQSNWVVYVLVFKSNLKTQRKADLSGYLLEIPHLVFQKNSTYEIHKMGTGGEWGKNQ